MTNKNLILWASPLLRLGFGLLFLVSGVLKFLNLEGTSQFIASVGIPLASIFAFLVAIVEVVGGIFLLLGLWTRWTSLWLAIFLLIILLVIQVPSFVKTGVPTNLLNVFALFLGLLALSCLGTRKWCLVRD